MGQKPLYKKILDFEQWREFWILPLILIGLIGILLPIIPGLLILYFALMMIDPEKADKVRDFFVDLIKTVKK